MRLVWTPLALERVEEAAGYVAGERPEAARRWARSLFSVVGRLESFPEGGRLVPELPHRRDLREVIHAGYRVIYRVEPEQVSVLTVRHGRRLPDPVEVGEEE